jgi:GT2 family glycosyltransferase/glycosyltransferase involved in cell wall biosynthesis
VILLNSDMRVEPDFIAPLLEPFRDPALFATSCQIFFSDPHKRREETGLTQAWWRDGSLRLNHRIDESITRPYPAFYAGGGSCAVDRAKFLELGGFDPILEPFYFEDTDLSYSAWKRGWKILYCPASRVYHEHRGTIGRKFSHSYIQGVLKKNLFLFVWKNIHDARFLISHLWHAYIQASVSLVAGDAPERASFAGFFRALLQLPHALAARFRARSLAAIPDPEAFRRTMGGYFHDRFLAGPQAHPPAVLFVSPYAIDPPVHGGAVFMYHTIRELARLTPTHLICCLDLHSTREAHSEFNALCRSVRFLDRLDPKPNLFSTLPHAVNEFRSDELEWLIHKTIYLESIQILQLEYLQLAQYGAHFHNIRACLFEHDVYFQSIRRGLLSQRGIGKLQWLWEYFRAFRYELKALTWFHHVQVCSESNRRYLIQFAPRLAPKLLPGLRAGVPAAQYTYHEEPRREKSLLFLGSFRHLPNQLAVEWFLRHVFPRILQLEPLTHLTLVGADPPPPHALPGPATNVDLVGFVPDIRQPLSEHSVFICPITSGSGIRVKLIEAFASGIPVVSTRLGAEGLADTDGEFCRLADEPHTFAQAVLDLLNHPEAARQMTRRAHREILDHWNIPTLTQRLLESYEG